MNTVQSNHKSSKKIRHRNQMAALLSIIPGLGHIYKGHIGLGITLLLLSFTFIWIGLMTAFATVGIGLTIPFFYVILTACHAYYVDDQRKHHLGIF